MTAVTIGDTSSTTLDAVSTVSVDLGPSEAAHVVVRRDGVPVFSQALKSSRTIGPFQIGDVVSVTAQRGTVDYTVDAFAVPVGLALPSAGAGTFALQSIDGVLTWVEVV
jgi:hypothetical protein